MRPTENIENIIKKFDIDINTKRDQEILDEIQQARASSKQSKSSFSVIDLWRTIMKSKMTKFAVAAVIIIAISIGINQFGGSIDGASVAWANAMEHFVTAQTARFDLSIEFGEQEPQTSSFLYDAKGYIRQNMANGTVNFVDYNRNKVFSLVPDSNVVVIRDVRKSDFHTALYDIFTKLQDLIQQAIDLGYGPVKSIGTKNIDGHTAYGYCVETTGQSQQSPSLYWQGKGTLTIWADAETDFPLILKWHNNITDTVTVSNICLNVVFSPDELSITIPDGYIIRDETLAVTEPQNEENFIGSDVEIDRQANAVLEAAIQLGADIPKDQRSKVFRMLSLKEKDLIKGLATYLEYSDGNYPPSMIINEDFMKDIDTIFSEAVNQGRIDKKTGEAEVFDLFYAGSFYEKLKREKKEPAYYGATTTISKPNNILVRWKLSKNKYRVIYSSLKAETVTAEKLAELEEVSITK